MNELKQLKKSIRIETSQNKTHIGRLSDYGNDKIQLKIIIIHIGFHEIQLK